MIYKSCEAYEEEGTFIIPTFGRVEDENTYVYYKYGQVEAVFLGKFCRLGYLSADVFYLIWN